MTQRSRASDIWPHLPSSSEVAAPEQQQQRPSSIAASLYPHLVPKPKRETDRDHTLRLLRELNARLRRK
jgi:hypothetical protein